MGGGARIADRFHPRYISNIEIPGGKIVYVPLSPPEHGAERTCSSADWTVDFEKLEAAVTPKTKMIVINTPRKTLVSLPKASRIERLCG